ncbi:MAG: hypothetical protein IT158_18250 [Bryobacterales bacterium]|nr:hypothetical protein [Bryobacterales bacterium]
MLACVWTPLHATTLEKLSLDDMILRSTAIVRGRVVSSQAAFHKSLIYTHFNVQVLERWKGPSDAVLDVAIPGGATRNFRQSFAGAPQLAVGSEYLFFLWTGRSGITHVIGLSQGVLDLDKSAAGDVIVGRESISEPMLDPKTGRLAVDNPIRMRLIEMRDRIRRTLAGTARQ